MLYYNQSVQIGLAHRLYTDVQYFFSCGQIKSWKSLRLGVPSFSSVSSTGDVRAACRYQQHNPIQVETSYILHQMIEIFQISGCVDCSTKIYKIMLSYFSPTKFYSKFGFENWICSKHFSRSLHCTDCILLNISPPTPSSVFSLIYSSQFLGHHLLLFA